MNIQSFNLDLKDTNYLVFFNALDWEFYSLGPIKRTDWSNLTRRKKSMISLATTCPCCNKTMIWTHHTSNFEYSLLTFVFQVKKISLIFNFCQSIKYQEQTTVNEKAETSSTRCKIERVSLPKKLSSTATKMCFLVAVVWC